MADLPQRLSLLFTGHSTVQRHAGASGKVSLKRVIAPSSSGPTTSDLHANVRHPVIAIGHMSTVIVRAAECTWSRGFFHRLAQQGFSASLRAPQMNATKPTN